MGFEADKAVVSLDSYKQERVSVVIDNSRDELLSGFGRAVLLDRYLYGEESIQEMFARVAAYYADDAQHAQRMYEYISKLWLIPATPVLSNGGTKRGLPISCFLNEVGDSLESIVDVWEENVWLAANGGGIGTYWGNVRSMGERIGRVGNSSGVVPFIKVMETMSLAISQGSLRRGSAAVYMNVEHPEIEEFIHMRDPLTIDANRQMPHLHHGVVIPDAFMRALEENGEWLLRSPKTGEPISSISAWSLWIQILTSRMRLGEPYILFIDRVNAQRPMHHVVADLQVKTSNLCSEITLPTGLDHLGNRRTAVCCLSSLNLMKYDMYKEELEQIVIDSLRFLDNVLTDFINNAPKDKMKAAIYSATRERSVGLGAMGWHYFLQSQGLPFESNLARSWNIYLFKKIRNAADKASRILSDEKGPCLDAAEFGYKERFSYKLAIAPNASTSIIADSSPGIEPIVANTYTHKTRSGSFFVFNPFLRKMLENRGVYNEQTRKSIVAHSGSVQHLDCLSYEEKQVFKTAYEINQNSVVTLAADRAKYIDQSQSVNLFMMPDMHRHDVHKIHFKAWQKGVKSLYYCRSRSMGAVMNSLKPPTASNEEEVQDKVQVAGATCEGCD